MDDEGEIPVIVMDAHDGMAYAQMLGRITECGDAFIIDPYLGTSALMDVITNTTACRFLISEALEESRVTELKVLIATSTVHQGCPPRELRRLPRGRIHDRFVLGERAAYTVGTSLTNVGQRALTTLIKLPSEFADAIRQQAEGWWDEAEVLSQSLTPTELAAISSAAPEPEVESDVVREEGGKFLHDGCPVKHERRERPSAARMGAA